ncbi:uncharacterized protein BYT42DRAFT_573301 [Radiomyces spectabilis]|uniref:uncharacterized protein n=1 Tax=Radiomyces spectabilis TaxID=64574 RepID=UPI00222077CB|nr:uncharacterized protein BYT42DRAFT_573301 [Radiomyces spectabilis]KAI8376069.1 hypothetical protein BYT42DRAFT_573301 [Radiomyces spectabilis]
MEATQSAPLLASPSSSPTSPVSSSQSSDRIAAGAACSPVGHQRCVASGNSAEWATCDFGVWLVRSCGTGLICRDDQAPLVCDFPLDPTHQQMELYQAEIA